MSSITFSCLISALCVAGIVAPVPPEREDNLPFHKPYHYDEDSELHKETDDNKHDSYKNPDYHKGDIHKIDHPKLVHKREVKPFSHGGSGDSGQGRPGGFSDGRGSYGGNRGDSQGIPDNHNQRKNDLHLVF